MTHPSSCDDLPLKRASAQDVTSLIDLERERMARKLHDGVAQNLAVLLIKAQVCQSLAGQRADPAAAAALARELECVVRGLQDAIGEVRGLIAQMHDPAEPPLTLSEGLHDLAKRLREQAELDVQMTCEAEVDDLLTPAATQALLNVAQEAFSNIRRHARAVHVDVHLASAGHERVVLRVHDDGCGFDPAVWLASSHPAPDEQPSHFGLRMMRRRVGELGGRVEVESAVGAGATVVAILPLIAREGAGSGKNFPVARG